MKDPNQERENQEGEEKTKSWLNQTHIIAAAINHSFK